jgi:hypothetical protein
MQFEIESSWSQLVLFRSLRPGREIKVVVVYEEFHMGLQGKKISDRICREAGRAAPELTAWRFDRIRSATLTAAAVRQAEEADLIIVAPRHPDNLPPQVCVWLEEWSANRKPGHGALIALFDARTAVTSRRSNVARLLVSAAQRAGMNYFFCKEPIPEKPAARSAYALPTVKISRRTPPPTEFSERLLKIFQGANLTRRHCGFSVRGGRLGKVAPIGSWGALVDQTPSNLVIRHEHV